MGAIGAFARRVADLFFGPHDHHVVEEMPSLANIVVVNESPNISQAGDVAVFRGAADACQYLEHWWVENEYGFAFTASGDRLILGAAQDAGVWVAWQEPCTEGAEIVRAWLCQAAASVLDARRYRAKKGKLTLSDAEEQGHLPESIEDLIEYIGFTR